MRKFFKYVTLVPLALIFLAFALANRGEVTIAFDPFESGGAASPKIVLPLFLVLIGTAMLGVLVGGFASWLGQGRHRKALRQARADLGHLRDESDALRKELRAAKTAAHNTLSSQAALGAPQNPALPPPQAA